MTEEEKKEYEMWMEEINNLPKISIFDLIDDDVQSIEEKNDEQDDL